MARLTGAVFQGSTRPASLEPCSMRGREESSSSRQKESFVPARATKKIPTSWRRCSTPRGSVRLVDLMPYFLHNGQTRAPHQIVRVVEQLRGRVEMKIEYD